MTSRPASELQVAELAAQVAALHGAVDELRAELAPDLARLATLLVAAVAAVGGTIFTAAELVHYAVAKGDEALQQALVPILGPDIGEGVNRLGRYLMDRAGRSAGGLTLVHLRKGRDGQEFMISVTTATKIVTPVAPTPVR